MRNVYAYRAALTPEALWIGAKNLESGSIREFKITSGSEVLDTPTDKIADVLRFLKFLSKQTLVSWGSSSFDDRICNWIIVNHHSLRVKERGDVISSIHRAWLGRDDWGFKDFKKPIRSADLARISGSKDDITRAMPNAQVPEIAFLPISSVPGETISRYVRACLLTIHRAWDQYKESVELRHNVGLLFRKNFLGDTDIQLGTRIFSDIYAEASSDRKFYNSRHNKKPATIYFKDIVFDDIEFSSDRMSSLLDDIKSSRIDTSERKPFERKFLIGNTAYTMGLGGLHSNNLYEKHEDVWYVDVSSNYASLIINRGVFPRTMNSSAMKKAIHYLIEEKEDHEKAGSSLASVYKRALVSIYGRYGHPGHWMYDLHAMYRVTINMQLLILMLIESLEDIGCNVIYANTDGIAFTPCDPDKAREITRKWARSNGFKIKANAISKMLVLNVNNYALMIKHGDESKVISVGDFSVDHFNDYSKTLNMPIIPMAILDYMFHGTPIEETVNVCDHPHWFAGVVTSTNGFHLQRLKNGAIESRSIRGLLRFVASKSGKYGVYKIGGTGKLTNMDLGTPIAPALALPETASEIEDLDRDYYIRKAKSLANLFESKTPSLF